LVKCKKIITFALSKINNNNLKIRAMKELLENIGNFNGWKGNICLYFPKKKVRELKRYGITEDMDIKQAYLKVSNIKNI
jgi:hypothetical protein